MMNGITVTPLKKISHPKGDIYHAMKASSIGYDGFGEAYFSTIRHGEIKGWKCHLRATLNLIVIVGEIRFAVFDSETDKFFEITLGPTNYSRLTIRSGLWVAFKGMGSGVNVLLNISSEEHDPAEAKNIELSELPYIWSEQ